MVETCTLYYTPYEYNQKQDIEFYLHQEGPDLGKILCPCYHHSKTPGLGPILRDMPDCTSKTYQELDEPALLVAQVKLPRVFEI